MMMIIIIMDKINTGIRESLRLHNFNSPSPSVRHAAGQSPQLRLTLQH